MLAEQQRLIKRCEKWKNSLAYNLSLKPTRSSIENICHSSTYFINWLCDLRNCDEKVFQDYLLTSKYHLNKASEVIFNYYFFECRNNLSSASTNRKKYTKSVGKLIDHMYYILWCSYYAENYKFIDYIYNFMLSEIAANLPPTSCLKGRTERRVGRAMWELLTYFEKLLDYDAPSWAIQKFQTEDLIKPRITEDETYNIMTALDNIELSNPTISDDVQYRFLRSELLRSTEHGSRERRRILKGLINRKCECGSSVKLAKSNIIYGRDEDNLMLVTTVKCKVCGRSYDVGSPVVKTKAEFNALDQLDEYLDSNYSISLMAKIKETARK